MEKICFFCDTEIKDDDIYWLEPIERPCYGNLFFHKDKCRRQIENMAQYLSENYEKVIKYIGGSDYLPKKKVKRK